MLNKNKNMENEQTQEMKNRFYWHLTRLQREVDAVVQNYKQNLLNITEWEEAIDKVVDCRDIIDKLDLN